MCRVYKFSELTCPGFLKQGLPCTAMMLKDMPASEKPRERLIKRGPGALSGAELIAILLRVGTPGKGVMETSRELIATHSLIGLVNKSYEELVGIKGLGKSKACLLLAVGEVCRRIHTNRGTTRPRVNTPEQALILCPELKHMEKEHLIALYLNSRHGLIKKMTLSVGNLNSSIVDPREVYKHALRSNAFGVVLLHNHPSGNPEPSDEDVEVTKVISKAGQVLNIPLIDHIVVGTAKFISLSERGLF